MLEVILNYENLKNKIFIGSCNLGDPLNKKVETFVGISGANYGLCACQGAMELTCNQQVL